jgi:hypothetical protein
LAAAGVDRGPHAAELNLHDHVGEDFGGDVGGCVEPGELPEGQCLRSAIPPEIRGPVLEQGRPVGDQPFLGGAPLLGRPRVGRRRVLRPDRGLQQLVDRVDLVAAIDDEAPGQEVLDRRGAHLRDGEMQCRPVEDAEQGGGPQEIGLALVEVFHQAHDDLRYAAGEVVHGGRTAAGEEAHVVVHGDVQVERHAARHTGDAGPQHRLDRWLLIAVQEAAGEVVLAVIG